MIDHAESLKVALLNPTFWPEVQRGSERLAYEVATDLRARGHRPSLITSHPGPPRRSREYGFPLIRHWRPPDLLLRVRKFQEHLTHVPFTYQSLTSGDFDVANAFHPSDGLAAVRWSAGTGRPAVLTYNGVPQRSVVASKRLRRQVLEQVTTRSQAVVVPSQASREGMWRWLGVEARVIYPGVDLELFTPGGERDADPTIACAAAVDDGRKRIKLLVAAFRRVRRRLPRARLLLMRPVDPRRAATLRDEDAGIELFDPDMAGVASVYRRAWATGLASYNEAFGLVLVESLACGTPVFGARDGGVPEIIDRPEVGRLFDGDDEEQVAKAILETLELCRDPDTAARCRCRAERFGTEACGAAYESLYRELLTVP